jgi:hypothetical protein
MLDAPTPREVLLRRVQDFSPERMADAYLTLLALQG